VSDRLDTVAEAAASRDAGGRPRHTRWGEARRAVPADQPAAVTVPALLSVATVARLLDCSPRTVRRRIADCSLPAVMERGRVMVRGDELRAYVDALERAGGARARAARRRASTARYDFLRE
jgi:excisionase family DNA binding protein